MKKPELDIENFQAVYDYYDAYNGNERVLRAAMKLSQLIYRTHPVYLDNCDKTYNYLSEEGYRYIFASNHQNFWDQFAIADTILQSDHFTDVYGNVSTPTKRGHYKWYTRRVFDWAGSIPAYRKQDTEGVSKELRGQATERMIEVAANKVIKLGRHIMIFPEGTRNNKTMNSAQLQTVRQGTMRIAQKIDEADIKVAVVPMAVWWGNKKEDNRRILSPATVVAPPILGPFISQEEANITLTDSMRYAKETAILLNQQRC